MARTKIPTFYFIKCSPKHRFLNWIQSLVGLIDKLIEVLTLGFLNSGLLLKFIMFRLTVLEIPKPNNNLN